VSPHRAEALGDGVAGDAAPVAPGLAIEAVALGKCHRIFGRPSDRLWQGLLGSRRKLYREFWALRDIDLQVARGETVGIVGRNGAGKSTLLQLIAGTMRATTGEVRVAGRIAALLELGSGFNMDFTGRENVFLNAQVLGMRRHEVEQRFDRIAEFAGLGDFINEPTRTYSSGMVVRLAFSVAINTDPDILIIDEALAVGDEAFQRKCYSRIEELKRAGTTILFVSHAAQSVIQLCDRALLIDGGERLLTGRPRDVVEHYHRLLHATGDLREEILGDIRALDRQTQGASAPEPTEDAAPGPAAATVPAPVIRDLQPEANDRLDPGLEPSSRMDYPSQGALISDPHLVAPDGRRVNVLCPNGTYLYRFRVEFIETASQVEFGMKLKALSGLTLYAISSHGRSGFIPEIAAGTVLEVEFRFSTRLCPGVYFLNAGCQGLDAAGERRFLHRIVDAACFRIEATSTDRFTGGFYDLSSEPAAELRVVPGASA